MRRRYFKKKASSALISPLVGGIADAYYGNIDKKRMSEFAANRVKEFLGGAATDAAVGASTVLPVATGALNIGNSILTRKLPGKAGIAMTAASLLPFMGAYGYAAYRPLQMVNNAKARQKKDLITKVKEKLGLA